MLKHWQQTHVVRFRRWLMPPDFKQEAGWPSVQLWPPPLLAPSLLRKVCQPQHMFSSFADWCLAVHPFTSIQTPVLTPKGKPRASGRDARQNIDKWRATSRAICTVSAQAHLQELVPQPHVHPYIYGSGCNSCTHIFLTKNGPIIIEMKRSAGCLPADNSWIMALLIVTFRNRSRQSQPLHAETRQAEVWQCVRPPVHTLPHNPHAASSLCVAAM